MRRSIWERIREILKKHVLHGKWVRAVISLACVVIFITTYVLIMPAVTLSRAADCGQEEHTHTEDCYETENELTCGQEEHTHSGDCYDEEGNLICGMEEHVHDDGCYTSREVLVCGQEEHVHSEDCWAEPVQEDIPEEEYEEEQEESADEEGQPQTGDTVMEQTAAAAPEQLSQIRFKEYLTDWTTIYYVPEDGDNWQPLAEDKWHSLYEDNWGIRHNKTEDRGLDPEEEVLLHIGYRIPAGRINATNPQAEFILPLSINLTEEEVRDNNKDNYNLFSGTDREENELFLDGAYEIVEEWNNDGEVTLRKLVITFNEDACLRCGGEKLTDGTETLAPQELEGFFELRLKAEDLLTLEKKSESSYVLEWNDEEDLDTTVRFDPEKLTAYYDAKNGESAETEVEKPASGELRAEGEDYTIAVSYTEEAGLPAGVSLKVKEITKEKEYESYKAQMEEELIDSASTKVTGARFFDITLEDSEGNELHPESGVRVMIETKDTLKENEKVQICHFDEEKDKPVEVESREVTNETYEEENLGVEFEAESFSVYGVVYTVDFHWEVDGKTFEYSLPGGGFMSFRKLVEVLGIADKDRQSGKNGTSEGENSENSANNSAEADVHNGVEVPDVADNKVSEETRKFVEDVEKVEFSNPELVWVGKVDADITVGELKEEEGLEVQYSAELTEDNISEINAQTVESGDWALISMQPFDTEESMTVTLKNGEQFIIKVTDAQIKKTVIDAKGDTWEITVTYGEDAGIPDDAKLEVEEILPEDERYQEYYEKSLEKVGAAAEGVTDSSIVDSIDEADDLVELGKTGESEVIESTSEENYAHLFDIQIWAGEEKIEPKAEVAVCIKLLDAPANPLGELKVVHFGTEGVEVMALEPLNDSENSDEVDAVELNFTTAEFSVYAVVDDLSSSNLRSKLDGQSFVLVSSDALVDGTFPEPWGGSQNYSSYSDSKKLPQSLSSETFPGRIRKVGDGNNWGNSLDAKAVFFDKNGTVVGGEPTLWTFEFTGNNTCRLKYGNQYVEVYYQDPGGYVSADYCLYNLRLSNNGTIFTISESNGGVRLSYGGRSITNVLSNPYYGDSRRLFAMSNNNSGASLFTVCTATDAYNEYKATKISAADLEENKPIVIYHKDSSGNIYALADDGTYVPMTESGESVYWRTLETGKNILWNMTITSSTSGYYDFTSVANPAIHISPSETDDKVVDTKYVGVTLDGRQNGTYSSTIKAWDDPKYSWVGIQKDGDTATHVLGAGDEFMFAEYSDFTKERPQTVSTVDSETLGIKLRMFDYSGDSFISYSGTNDPDNRLYGMRYAVNGDISTEDDYDADQTSGLVEDNLEGGLPVSSASSGDMSMLFSPGTQTYTVGGKTFTKTDKGLANHLFIENVYEETGYFHYSSAENYAYLNGNNFNVYQQIASPTIDPRNDQQYFFHGHFMPYNDIYMGKTHDSILYDQFGNPLNISDPRTYEMVYGISGEPNFFTGMSMEADFAQLKDGKDKNGNDVVFRFTGDDDMWVFVDGVRVLDLGGIHEALSGTINFATGEVNVNGDTSHDLYWFYEQAGKADSVKWKDGPNGHKIFADYSTHSFNMFYMERGAGASNLDLHFNLPVIKAGSFTVAKKLSEPTQAQYADVRFAYRAYLENGTVLKPGVSEFKGITYEGTNNAVQMDDDGVFYLKPGEAATIQLNDKDTRYYVEELGFDTELYSNVDIIEEPGTITMLDTTSYPDYPLDDFKGDHYKVARSTTENVANRGRVTYENTPKKLDELHIKKKVINSEGQEVFPDESTTFEFKVFLEGTDGQLMPYMQDDYYLTKVGDDGKLHYYDINASGLVHVGYLEDSIFHAENEYTYKDVEGVEHSVGAGSTIEVGEAGYELPVCGNSGQNGSISKIPAGYTVVIKNLLAGTEFYVEERLESPRYYPADYYYVGKEVVEGTADPGTLSTENVKDNNNQPTDIADGTLIADTNGQVIVTNLLIEKTDISVVKNWNWSPSDQELFNDGQITSWSATFYLQYREEECVMGDPDSAQNVQSLWEYVLENGSPKQITITSPADSQSSIANSGTNIFENLPMYKVHENGSVYRLQYAVEESEYTINYSDGTISTWHKDDTSFEHYAPAYGEDAGQEGDSISVTNAPSTEREQKSISLGIQKYWEAQDGTISTTPPNNSCSASFVLKRYYHEEYLEIPDSGSINLVKLTLDLGNGNTTELEVPKNAPVYFTADLKTENPGIRLDFRRTSPAEPSATCTLSYPNDGHYASTDSAVTFVVSDPITLTNDETWTFVSGSSSAAEVINAYVLGGIDGIRLATFDCNDGSHHVHNQDFPYDVTAEIPDTSYEVEVILNSTNHWTETLGELPQIVEVITEAGGHTYLTTKVYSYYFEEISCLPEEYYPVFRDSRNHDVRYGDELSRVEVSGLMIDAINKLAPETTLYKVDKNDITQANIEQYLLSKASFKVVKYDSFSPKSKDEDWGEGGEKTATRKGTDPDGKFTVDGLIPGLYEIEEIDYPDGYIRVDENPRFEVVLNAETEELEIKSLSSEDAPFIITTNDSGENVIIYGNTPGAALPNAGGPGTTPFTSLGAMLIALAGAGLVWMRKKRSAA